MGGFAQIRVLIADDHPVERLGMEALLGAQPDMEIAGQAADGDEAVSLALRTRPDVILLDLHMPMEDGLTALRDLKRAWPAARCVLLSSAERGDQVLRALHSGAAGLLHRDDDLKDLLRAIRAIHQGSAALGPAATRMLIAAYRAGPEAPRVDAAFTPSERRVLGLLARGLSNRALAAELGVSVRTVTTHVAHVLDKLGMHRRAQAALYAHEHGLVA